MEIETETEANIYIHMFYILYAYYNLGEQLWAYLQREREGERERDFYSQIITIIYNSVFSYFIQKKADML